MIYRLFKLDLRNVDDRNAWYLSIEILFAAVLGSAATFSSAYALRLGATNTEIGLLSSLPSLLAILISIPAGRFLQARQKRAPWFLTSLLIHRTAFLFLPVIPFIKLPGVSQGLLLVGWLVVISIPATFFNLGWLPALADIIPENRRSAVFSARNMISGALVSVFTFLFGIWLKRVMFPVNYQLLYLVGFIFGLISQFFLYRLEMPDAKIPPPGQASEKQPEKNFMASIRQVFRETPEFFHITRNTLFHAIGLWMIGPIYILYFVRQLNADEAWLGLNGTVASLTVIIAYAFWRYMIGRLGESLTLKITIIGAGIYPILVVLFHNLTLILFATAINNFIAAGIGLSHTNTLLKCFPDDRRPQYYSIYTTIMNTGAFIAPMIGVALVNQFGIPPVLLVCGLVAILGSSTFVFWPVSPRSPQ